MELKSVYPVKINAFTASDISKENPDWVRLFL